MGVRKNVTKFFGRLAETERFMSSESSEDREKYGKLRFTALGAMKAAVHSCVWCDTEKTRQMMRYIDRKSVEAAKLSDISPNTVRSARSKASQRLYRIFGDDVFEGIICGDEKSCKRTITIAKALTKGYDRIENFVPDAVLHHVEERSCCNEKQYELSEIQSELTFLRSYNQIRMKNVMNALDTDKLAYIFSILKPSSLTYGEDVSVNMQKLRFLSKIM